MSNLHRGESKAAGLVFACLLLKPRSHMSVLASSHFVTDHKASLCSLSLSCHCCPLRHHHLGCMPGKGKICWSASRKQLQEESRGAPYSRSHRGGLWWHWGQQLELVMCVVFSQLSQGMLLWCKDRRWSHVSWWVRERKFMVCLCFIYVSVAPGYLTRMGQNPLVLDPSDKTTPDSGDWEWMCEFSRDRITKLSKLERAHKDHQIKPFNAWPVHGLWSTETV